MSTTPKFLITDAGLAAAALAHPEGPFIHITNFKVASSYGYTASASDTDVDGTLLFEGPPSSYTNIGDNIRNIICKLPADAGPFEFGNVGLFLEDGTLFAKAVFELPQEKLSSLGTNLLSTYTFNCLIQLEQTTSVIKVTTIDPAPELMSVEMWSDIYPPSLSADPEVQMMLVKELDLNGNSSLVHQADPNYWTVGTNYHFVAKVPIVLSTLDSVTIDSAGLDVTLLTTNNRQYVVQTADGYLRSASSLINDVGGYKFTLNPEPLTEAPVGVLAIYSNVPTGGGGGGGGTTGVVATLSSNGISLPADTVGVVSSYAGAASTISIIEGTTDITPSYTITTAATGGITFTQTGTTINVTHMDDLVDSGAVTFTAVRAGYPTLTKSYNITKIKGGGGSGTGGLGATLTKYSYQLVADSTGVVSSYTGASTTMNVTIGTIDDTANWTFTKADSAGLTSTLSGSTVTVTNITNSTDSGTVTITANKAGNAPKTLVFSIAKVKAGTPGAGVTITLTKDTWVFPADNAGNVVSYSGATTVANVYIGTQDDTANWTLTKTDSTGVTSTLTGSTVTVSGFLQANDTGTVTITATRAGFPNSVKQFSLTKSKAGEPGGSGGTRGSMTFYLPNHTSWSDADATAAASVFGGPIVNDAVHQYDMNSGFSSFRIWTGTIWQEKAPVVDGANILNGTVAGTKFASGIEPVGVVSALPNPSGYTGPKVVFLTTDGKLYRLTGGAWTANVPAVNITGQLTDAQIAQIAAAKLTGQITATQITDGAISTPKLAAGSVTAAVIAADTITASQIAANAITTAEIATGAITATKIAAGAVTAAAIEADSITAGQIAAGAINTTELAAGAITAAKIAAMTISGDKIAANTITASNIATNTITAASGVIANAAINTLQLAGNSVTQAVAFNQDPQVEINNSSSWQTICTANITLSGSQPTLIMGSALLAGARIGSAGDYDIFFEGNYWKFNTVNSGADFRYQVFNNISTTAITGVTVAPASSNGVPINAILPILPAANYTIWMQAKLSGSQAVGVRQCRMMVLETKR